MSSEDEDQRVAIGLSFGNSYSSIACIQGGDAQVIANEEGDRQIPTVLSYVEGEEFQGTQAKSQLVRNASNTCAGFRDYLGKNFDSIDPTPSHTSAHPQAYESSIAFTVRDKPTEQSSDPSTVSVSEITTRYLRRLKTSAADYLGKPVSSAVLTIPTDFTSPQKEALTAAAQSAGLTVLQLITEPAAALLAHDRKTAGEKPADKTVVLADFGGHRSDVSVISVKGGMYSILATSHEYGLGGSALDEVLIEHFAKEFQKKNKSASDPRKDARGAAKLRLESEAAKKALSIGNTANFNVESLADGVDFSATVNRTRYDLLAGKVFARFTRLVEDVVKKAELDVLDIDEVVLAGGTSHTPRIAQNIRGAFPESTKVVAPATASDVAVNPSELIARGAALQSYLIEGFEQEDVEQSTHPAVTATPHLGRTVGFVVLGGGQEQPQQFKPLISAETPLPVRRTVNFTNAAKPNSADSKTTGLVLRLCEGHTSIKVTQPEKKTKSGDEKKQSKADDDDSDEDDEESDDEPEEIREKIWEVGGLLGELALKDVKPKARVTVQVSVSVEGEVSVSAMEQGKTGVKGTVEGSGAAGEKVMNGSAK
ncbi:MAG: Hsp70 protein that interacts with Zuo1p [Alyxoria varia]|nr:MAG: Hsp70 protein that interacts with Zuo1p [Alyxoria varia]